MTISVVTERIGPAQAEQYLTNNLKNRKLNRFTVLGLAGQMETGAWQQNGETLKFSHSGTLLDGQHRLAAVILSGVPVEFMVARGLPEEAFETIDTQRPRKPVDALVMNGHVAASILASGTGAFWRFMVGAQGTERVPTPYILETIERYPSLVTFAQRLNSKEKAARALVPASALIPALVYLNDIAGRPDLAEDLLYKLNTGANLEPGDPVLALRNRFLTDSKKTLMRRDGGPSWSAMVRIIDAIESGEKLVRLHMTGSFGKMARPASFARNVAKLSATRRLDDLPPNFSVGNSEASYKLVKRLQPKNRQDLSAKAA